MKLCSACLLGVRCRYDGKSKPHKGIIMLSEKEALIPVCPEEFGGLPIPRELSEQRGGMVFSKSGENVTKNFRKGARETLKIAKKMGVKEAILKQRSPSCGSGEIYDGTFAGKVIKGNGVTTKLLKQNGIKVISEEDIGEYVK